MVIGWLVRRRERCKDQGRPTNHDGGDSQMGPEPPWCCLMVIAHAVKVEPPSGKGSEKSRVLLLRMTSTTWVLASSPPLRLRSGQIPRRRTVPPDQIGEWMVRPRERSTRHNSHEGMGWRMPVSQQFRIRLKCRSPYGGECTNASCCLSGIGASLVDVGMTRERTVCRQFRPRACPGSQRSTDPLQAGR